MGGPKPKHWQKVLTSTSFPLAFMKRSGPIHTILRVARSHKSLNVNSKWRRKPNISPPRNCRSSCTPAGCRSSSSKSRLSGNKRRCPGSLFQKHISSCMRVHGTKRASSIVCSIVAGRIRKDCRRRFLARRLSVVETVAQALARERSTKQHVDPVMLAHKQVSSKGCW
jgi:hypothetical protein